MTRAFDTDVLVVGAGPAGLMAAITLAQHGVACRVVDRAPGRPALPRATVISTRSMELLRALGLEGEIRAGSVDVEWLMWTCESLAAVADGHGSPVGYPDRDEAAAVSPVKPECVPQDHLEPVLARHLRRAGGARITYGTELAALDDGEHGVTATLRDTTTGRERTLRARYAIGADGHRSTVREQLGIGLRDEVHIGDGVMAVFHAPLLELVGEHRYGLYDITGPGAGLLLPAGPGDRWLYGLPQPTFGDRPVTEHIAAAAGVPDLAARVSRVGAFTFAGALAERFTGRSTFLVGDAAHRVTPRGGTGMNSALHDGFDLGWKLAWVLRGWGDPPLLDTYEEERRPVIEHQYARSTDPKGARRTAAQELPWDLGDRLPHVWLADGRSTLDLLAPQGVTLLAGPEAHLPAGVPLRAPLTTARLDHDAADALGLHPRGALLVRPDGREITRTDHALVRLAA